MFALNRSSRRIDACDWDSHVNIQQLELAAAAAVPGRLAAEDGGDIFSWLVELVGGIGGQYNFSKRRRFIWIWGYQPIKIIGPVLR